MTRSLHLIPASNPLNPDRIQYRHIRKERQHWENEHKMQVAGSVKRMTAPSNPRRAELCRSGDRSLSLGKFISATGSPRRFHQQKERLPFGCRPRSIKCRSAAYPLYVTRTIHFLMHCPAHFIRLLLIRRGQPLPGQAAIDRIGQHLR